MSSEKKGADLRLYFRICRLLVFSYGGSIIVSSEEII